MGDRAYIGPIVLFVLAGLGVFGGGVTVSVILAVVAVTWFGSVEAMHRREAEAERQRAGYRAAKEREAAQERAAAQEREVAEADDFDVATDAKSVLGPAYLTAQEREAYSRVEPRSHRVQSPTSGAWHPCQCYRGRDHLGEREAAQEPVTSVLPERLGLLARLASLERPERIPAQCSEHPICGPVTRVGHSGHGHGPSEATGLWCWHFDESWLGRPDEVAEEGSDLAARRAQQAEVNGGDPFAHKTYPTNPWA